MALFTYPTTMFLQYLCPKTGSNEGGSTGGASPAAHGVSDCFVQLVECQDSMKRSLERTGQSWKQMQYEWHMVVSTLLGSLMFLLFLMTPHYAVIQFKLVSFI